MRISDWSSDVCSSDLCIGCKACEVACKEWNQLPAEAAALTGLSYDNTGALSATTWRHVAFVEQMAGDGERPDGMPPRSEARSVGKGGVSTLRTGWWPCR